MTRAADDRSSNEHEAAPFPSEREWWSLPLPWCDETAETRAASLKSRPTDDVTETFAERVIRARREERAIDRDLRALDRALLQTSLQRLVAPTPSADFVARVVQRVDEQRRGRWAKALARHVATEPSPAFVTRTLEAIAAAPPQNSADAKAGSALPVSARSKTPIWGLLSAAAAASLWFTLTDRATPPVELRIADQAPAIAAYADAPSPMAAILAAIADEEEPHATVTAPVDGVWLHGETRSPR